MCDKSQYAVLRSGYKYKPGQLITINGRLYRIKKYLSNDTDTLKCNCDYWDCEKAFYKRICTYCIIRKNIRFSIPQCSKVLINEGKGRYLELVSE